MKFKNLVLVPLLTLSFMSNVANALTAQQESQINQKMQQIALNIKQGNVGKLAGMLSPKVIAIMAKRAKVPPQQFKADAVELSSALTANIKFANIKYDLKKGPEGHTALRDYLFLPYSFDMTIGGKKYPTQDRILFLSDDNQWYVVRVKYQSQFDTVKQAYPDLANIEFPK